MGWHTISVTHSVAEALAARLAVIANEPATWSWDNVGAIVMWVNLGSEDRFYLSPRAAAVLGEVIAAHGGRSCDPPLTSLMVPDHTARLVFGFKTQWEPFRPPRIVSTRPLMPGIWRKV